MNIDGFKAFDDIDLKGLTEAQLKKKLSESGVYTETEMQKLLHEHMMQRIELEMRNEELKQLTRELKLARDCGYAIQENYSKLYELSPSGYFTLSHECLICDHNSSGASLLGTQGSGLIGRDFKSLISEKTMPVFKTFFTQIFEDVKKAACEVELNIREQSPLRVYIEGIAAEGFQKCLIVVIDISEHEKNGRYRQLIDLAPVGIGLAYLDGRVISANLTLQKMSGYSREELATINVTNLYVNPAERETLLNIIMKSGRAENYEVEMRRRDGTTFISLINMDLIEWNGQKALLSTQHDVTSLKRIEKEREAMANILQLINDVGDHHELMQAMCMYLQKWSGIEAVGIRMRDGEDFPYYVTQGFQNEFVQTENKLCSIYFSEQGTRCETEKPTLECMCGNVLCGRFDPEKPFFTKRGSFWTNSTSEFKECGAEGPGFKSHARNRCNNAGYESVALIPLRLGKNIFGLIQFNDKRKGFFKEYFIDILERICGSIAIALSQRHTAEKLGENEARYRSLFMNTPAAILENDFSKVKKFFDNLRDSGVEDFNAYFKNNPDTIYHCLSLIKILDVNDECIRMSGARDKNDLIKNMPIIFSKESFENLRDEFVALANGKKEFKYECSFRSLNGDELYCTTRLSVVPGFENDLSKVYVTISDISEHKKMENQLKLACEHNVATLNALPDMMFEVDREGWLHDFHSHDQNTLYTSPVNFLGKKLSEVLPENASAIILESIAKASQYGQYSGAEYSLCFPDATRWFELSISAKGNHADPQCHFIALVRDITERKNSAEELKQSEKRFRHVIENMPAGTVLFEKDKIFVNSRVEELTGYSRSDLDSPKTFFNILFKEGAEKAREIFESIVDKCPVSISLPLYRKDGAARIVDISRMHIEGQLEVWTFFDVTDYLNVQYKLLKSESHLLQAHRVANIGSYEFNLLTGEIIWSELCYEITGIERQTVNFELLKSLIHPDDLNFYCSHFFDLFSKNFDFSIEYRIKRPDEKIIFIHDEARITFDDNGKPLYCIGYFKDITSRKNIEEELKKSEQKKIQLIELAHEGYWAINEFEKTTFVNKRASEIIGYSKEEIIEKNLSEFFDENHYKLFLSAIEKCRRGEKCSLNSELISRDGHRVFVNMTVSSTFDEKGCYTGSFALIDDFTKQKELEKEIRTVRQELMEKYTYNEIVGKSAAMRTIFESLPTIAEIDCNVLIEGASGTGKNLIAKNIYNISNRKNKPFVVVNCGTLPENLLESELFGYVKGAFTGADKDKHGKFAVAEGGVVFLDEIGEMPLNLQVKILRIIEEKRFEPIGSNKTLTSDVRIIAATNKDLKALVNEGKFRADLYFRLKIVSLKIPSLKERHEDIDVLSEYFINHFNEKYNKNINYISDEISRFFKLYDFPGNVRELKNMFEHSFIFCNGAILQMHHMASEYRSIFKNICDESLMLRNIESEKQKNKKAGISPNDIVEKNLIIDTIKKCNNNKSMAARALKMDYSTLWRKMKKYDLDRYFDQASPSDGIFPTNGPAPAEKTKPAAERENLREALKKANNNKAEAARILKIDRTTLWRKLKKHGLI